MLTRRTALAGLAGLGVSTIIPRRIEAFGSSAAAEEALAFEVPSGACDCHVHVIDTQRFPTAPGGRPRPPATVDGLRAVHARLHVDRVVIVNSTGYGNDNSCLLDALQRLEGRARGIAGLPETVSSAEINKLNEAGVRGVRLPIGDDQPRTGPHDQATITEGRAQLEAYGRRLAGTGWNINTRIPVSMLAAYEDALKKSPVPVVIDHFAVARVSLGGSAQVGFEVLRRLLGSGNVYLKLSEVDAVSSQPPDFSDVKPLVDAVLAANADRILWGTDWQGNSRIDDLHMFNRFATWVPDPTNRQKILVTNPARLYGF